MSETRNTLLTQLREVIAAMDRCLHRKDLDGLHRHVKTLKTCAGHLCQASEPSAGEKEEILDLHQKLQTSKTAFQSTVQAYKAILDAFDTFRDTIERIQQLKRLEELPQALAAIKHLRSLHTLHLILDREIFDGRTPADIQLASPRVIRQRLLQFSPAPHAPRMYLGETSGVEDPDFFLGLDHPPAEGSCFVFALGHKYLRGKTIGIMSGYDPDPERYAPDKATDFLSHFCDILACTLITLAEHSQLEELTVRDALTGVNNRAYLERHAPRILDFAARKNLPVHLLFIDLNGFKAVNDQLGHEAGDQVLITVAKAIQSTLRKYDIFVRLGGDEFVVLLPDTDAGMTKAYVRRLRQALAQIDVPQTDRPQPAVCISASVGISLHEPGQSLDELIRAADQAMYNEKNLSSRPRPENTLPTTSPPASRPTS
jgi:diguanylate cyclase (GGDEF)-like protein